MSPTPKLRIVEAAGPEALGPVTTEALFARYARHVAGVAARLLGRGDSDVDDVVQDVFWLASRRIAKIPDLVQGKGWLTTVTTRVVRRRLVRRRFRALFHAERPASDVPARGATAEERAMIVRLYEVLERLPLDQ